MSEDIDKLELLALTADIMTSHLSRNSIDANEIPGLIKDIYSTLVTIGETEPEMEMDKPQPAVSVRKSIHPDYIVYLEDGKKLKMLKRHLKTSYNMTPEGYRQRWGLPDDYPMVPPNYAIQRRELAKKLVLVHDENGQVATKLRLSLAQKENLYKINSGWRHADRFGFFSQGTLCHLVLSKYASKRA